MMKSQNDTESLKLLPEVHLKGTEDSEQLHFSTYTNTLTSIIVNGKGKFAIALCGPWGTGKTSLINFIEKKLFKINDVNINKNGAPYYVPVTLNTWRYEDESQPLAPIIDEIRVAVNEHLNTQAKKNSKFTKRAQKGLASLNKVRYDDSIESLLDELNGMTLNSSIASLPIAQLFNVFKRNLGNIYVAVILFILSSFSLFCHFTSISNDVAWFSIFIILGLSFVASNCLMFHNFSCPPKISKSKSNKIRELIDKYCATLNTASKGHEHRVDDSQQQESVSKKKTSWIHRFGRLFFVGHIPRMIHRITPTYILYCL